MAIPTFKSFGKSVITKKWEGGDNRISPLGLEVELREGKLFERLLEKYCFSDLISNVLDRKLKGVEKTEYSLKNLNKLKNDIRGSKIKITIKIELEKYE